MENDVQIKELIESFVEYRNLLTPVEQNLRNFANTYDSMRTDIQELSHSFDGSIQKKLDVIYSDLSKQFEKSKDLSSQIDAFKQKTDKFGEKLTNLLQIFGNFESDRRKKISSIVASQIQKRKKNLKFSKILKVTKILFLSKVPTIEGSIFFLKRF